MLASHDPAAPLTLPTFLARGGKMGQAIAAHDWTQTSLGPISTWPAELRTVASIMLQTDLPTALWWGEDRLLLHNDAYLPILAERAPALGMPVAKIWGETNDTFIAELDGVFATAHGQTGLDARIDILRNGRMEECYWSFTMTPVLDSGGSVFGVFNSVHEVTTAVIERRFDQLILDLDNRLAVSGSSDAMIDDALALIGIYAGAKRTGFGEIDAAAAMVDIRRCWTSGAMPDIAGRHPLGSFGEISADLAQGKPVVIEDNRADPRTNDEATLAIYERIGLRSGIVIPILDRGAYVGGLFVQDDVPRRWLPHEIRLAATATQRLWSALARLRADTLLRTSEQRYRLIFEQAEDIIFTADTNQHITDANEAGLRAIGLSRDALVGRNIAEFVDSAGFEQTSEMLRRKLAGESNTRHEVAVTSADGRHMLWENNSTLIVDSEERPLGLLSISRDVTERRAFDERRELLIHELNHRVKNTLSLVQGIAHQSFRSGENAEAAAGDFLARLSSLAVAHDLLTREQWEGATIGELVTGATAHAAGRIDASGPHLLVSPKSAVALVMAMHELTTNAVKYGALSVSGGRVSVQWRATQAGRFALEWRETGGPDVEPMRRRGFGIRMIERALASDLGGTVQVEFAKVGVLCTIEGPVLA